MIRFIFRRTIHAAVLVFITLTATFVIIRIAPGDPLTRYYSPDIDTAAMARIRHQLGLDAPLPVQYAKTLWSFLHGNFGLSITENRPVSEILGETIPRTLGLTGLALLLQILIGLGLGMLSAARRYGLADKIFSIVFLVLYSIPSFYLAFVLIAVFSLKLQLFPSANMFSIDLEHGSLVEVVRDRIAHLVLPVSVLSLGSAAALARYTRGSVLEVINEEYIRTARAKGVSEGKIMWIHAFKNALPQVLTVVGLSFPFLLGGAVIVEKVFAWPGMGSLMVDSIFARDYPVVLAANFVGACMVILGNFLADVSYAWVDPRVKLASMSKRRGGRR